MPDKKPFVTRGVPFCEYPGCTKDSTMTFGTDYTPVCDQHSGWHRRNELRAPVVEPVNDRNLRCWATDNGLEIRFTPHLDLATTGPTRARFGVAGYTFHDVPMEVVAGLRHLQDTCAQLQERVWELEDRLDD